MSSRRLFAVALPLLVLAGACGGAPDSTADASDPTPSTPPDTPPSTLPDTPAAAPQDVVDAAVLTADDVGMPAYGEESSAGTDHEVSTFEYCSHGETGNGENLRAARAQG